MSDTPELFDLMPDEMVPLPGCNEEAIYLGCYRVKVGCFVVIKISRVVTNNDSGMQVNLNLVSDNTIKDVALPDGTVVSR